MKLLVLPMALLPEPMLSPGAMDFILQEVEIDPRPAMEYFGFTFRRLERRGSCASLPGGAGMLAAGLIPRVRIR